MLWGALLAGGQAEELCRTAQALAVGGSRSGRGAVEWAVAGTRECSTWPGARTLHASKLRAGGTGAGEQLSGRKETREQNSKGGEHCVRGRGRVQAGGGQRLHMHSGGSERASVKGSRRLAGGSGGQAAWQVAATARGDWPWAVALVREAGYLTVAAEQRAQRAQRDEGVGVSGESGRRGGAKV